MSEFIESLIGRPKTIKTYNSLFKNHIEPYVSPEEAKNFKQKDLTPLAKIWINKGLRPTTLNTILILFRQYLQWAGCDVERLRTRKLASKLTRLEQKEEPECLTKEQAEAVLRAAKKRKRKKMYIYCLLGFHAGLRRGEILGLKWEDLDAVNNRIIVRRAYRDSPTKSGKARKVPISDDLEEVLQSIDYLTRTCNEYVFPKIIHHPNIALANLCVEAGVPVITTHGMRRTFATLALESGISPKVVQGWLGHANLGTTLDSYWKVIPYETRMEFLPNAKTN